MRRTTALAAAVLALAVLVASAGSASAVFVTRAAGTDPYRTAVVVSQAMVPDPDVGPRAAVVVSGDDGDDALVGPVVAAELLGAAPVLLVRSDRPLAEEVEAELRRLRVRRVVLVGGPQRVSTAVEERIGTFSAVERIGGADPYATAVAVSQRYSHRGGQVVLVTGEARTRAIAGVLAAVAEPGTTLLLTRRDSLPPATREELRRLRPAAVHVVGGTEVISPAVRRDVAALAPDRLVEHDGQDRYAVQVQLLEHFDRGTSRRVHVVSGQSWPVAVVAAAYARRRGGTATLLVSGSCVPAVTHDHLVRVGYDRVDRAVIGGPAEVTAAAGHLRRC